MKRVHVCAALLAFVHCVAASAGERAVPNAQVDAIYPDIEKLYMDCIATRSWRSTSSARLRSWRVA